MKINLVVLKCFMCLCLVANSQAIFAFTQKGAGTSISNAVPMGHEWITRFSAIEILLPGHDPIMPPDPNDPRNKWTSGKAKNTNISSRGAQAEVARIKQNKYDDGNIYQPIYKSVYDAIMGERWVDIAGFNAAKSMMGKTNCFDAVAQEPVEVQYDHFMRRYDERSGSGGASAAKNSRERFIKYFVAAATAPPTSMKVWDGGAYSALTEVDRNYFLFGRAVHLFEDSFSSEHTVRIRTSTNNYESIRQVKSYMCASGSEQHTHSNAEIFNYRSGDVIWKPGTGLNSGWSSYKPSNMKDVALVSTEAMKDLWAAFIRTMGSAPGDRAQVAKDEAQHLVDNWLSYNEQDMDGWYNDASHRDATYVLADGESGPGQSVSTCMKNLGVASGLQMDKVHQLEEDQRMCLYNVVPEDGYADLYDTSFHMPFNWAWRTGNYGKWLKPPATWKIPTRVADTGVRVKIKSEANNQYVVAADGVSDNQWLYVKAGYSPLAFIKVPSFKFTDSAKGSDTSNGIVYRLASNPGLFLSYNATTGAVKFWSNPSKANFLVQPGSGFVSIKSLYWNQYMWLSGTSPYITRTGNPKNTNSRWIETAP
jgi:hypothetical protein